VNINRKVLTAFHMRDFGRQLELMALSPSARMRMQIAEHPDCPEHVLMLLADDPDPEVRMSVANNANVTAPILEQLTNDESADVRYYMAEDYGLPRILLRKLCEDENPYVAQRAQVTYLRVAQSQLLSRPHSAGPEASYSSPNNIARLREQMPRIARALWQSAQTGPAAI